MSPEFTASRLHTEKDEGNVKSLAADLAVELQFVQAFQVTEPRIRKHFKRIIKNKFV